jgi:3-phosphoglycerate kinase
MKFNRHVSPIENNVQDRTTDAWKALCRYIDELEVSGAVEFSPLEAHGPELFAGILSAATHSTANRVLKLFDTALELPISDTAKVRAAERATAKKSPFHRQKNSVADAVLAEAFHEFRTAHAAGNTKPLDSSPKMAMSKSFLRNR